MEIIVGILVLIVLALLYVSNTPKTEVKEAAVVTEQAPPVVTEVVDFVAPVKKTRAKPAAKAPVKAVKAAAKPAAKTTAKPAAKKTVKKTK